MNCDLWEGESDAGFVERGVDMLVHVEIDVPILSRRHPNADNHVNTAGSKRHQNENWLGIRENALIGGNEFTQGTFYLLEVLTIFH